MIQWTTEQQAILEAAARGEPGKVLAYAGTGKTTTLTGIAQAWPHGRLLYLAFNRAIADEAQRKFPARVECKTAHALAFRAQARWIAGREVVGQWWKLRPFVLRDCPDAIDAARLYGRTEAQACASLFEILQRFCQTADAAVGPQHVGERVLTPLLGAVARCEGPLSEADQRTWIRDLRARLVPAAQAVWDAMLSRPDWPVVHDVYLKRWQLAAPALPYDAVLFDEAQDASPVMQALVLQQPGVVWMVGDSYQQIYEWRGAIDALDQYAAPAYPLTRSWRFGPEVAATASRLLQVVLAAPWPLHGLGPTGAVRTPAGDQGSWDPACPGQTAVLCRTNIGVLQAAITALDARRAVSIAGGAGPVVDLCEAALALYHGQRVRHPELSDFATWDELRLASETAIGQSYRPLVQLVERQGEWLAVACRRLRVETVPEGQAALVLSTAHKAKGREWPQVVFGGDWHPFAGMDAESGRVWIRADEARLWYVACTRGRRQVDLTPAAAAWTASWEALTAAPIPGA